MVTGIVLALAVAAFLIIFCGSYWLAGRLTRWLAVHILGGSAAFQGHILRPWPRNFRWIRFFNDSQPTDGVKTHLFSLGLTLIYHGIAFTIFRFVLASLIGPFAEFFIPLMLGQR